ncbi:MAG: metal-dependent transcriptional regulator [Leptolyngbya sp. PLA1]|nr:metal-dependent transcriptional regulator [Leptolyngbya sp. PLA1]
MPSEPVENYLKAIFSLGAESGTGQASVGRLAAIVGVTSGTATSMVRRLAREGLATYRRYGGVRLTPRGRRAAADVIRRHRVLEAFLVSVVGMDWAEVHEEAERLEHAVSARLIDRLDQMLGRPRADPHGDPIPDAQGVVLPAGGMPLGAFRAGDQVRLIRIADQRADVLRFLAGAGLVPGASITVRSTQPGADAMAVRAGRRSTVSLSMAAASRIIVEPLQLRARPGPTPRQSARR